jgi:hypothetical protein
MILPVIEYKPIYPSSMPSIMQTSWIRDHAAVSQQLPHLPAIMDP